MGSTEAIFVPKQLVGLQIGDGELLADVTQALPDGVYRLQVRKVYRTGYGHNYDALLSAKTCTAFKGFAHQNASVRCDILKAVTMGDSILLDVKVAGDITKAQLRFFVRATFTLPITITGMDPETSFYGPPIKTYTLDVSAGGVRCLCTALYELGSEVNLELMYHSGEASAVGTVLRRTAINDSTYEYAIMFAELSAENRRLLAGFCEQAAAE